MIIEFASEVSNLAWRVSQSQNGGAIFARTKWSPVFGSVVFDYQWCILIVMSVKSSFYNEYDIKNNEKPVFWAQRSFQNHHQTFHDRCPEKIGPLPKKSDHWSTRTCPENIRPAPTWSLLERILDINVRSLYRRIYHQLNTTSISDRLQRYVDKMASIRTTADNNTPLPPIPGNQSSGRIRLSVSTASRTCELAEETHVTPFRTYIFRSTGLCNYRP